MRIYTSGCPHIQIRLMYIIAFPPALVVKKCIPNNLSRLSRVMVAVKIGKTVTTKIMLHKDVQVNMGIRIRVIPGALILRIVTIKLIPPIVVPIPDT